MRTQTSVRRTNSRFGFTLLEMMVVTGILALLSTVAIVHYRGPVERAWAEQTVSRIDLLDLRIRSWARRHGKSVRLLLDANEGRLWAESDGRPIADIPNLRLGARIQWGEFRLRGESILGGRREVPYTTNGTAPLWAYSLILSDQREIYRLMIGATGQSVELESLDEIQLWEDACNHDE